MGLPFGMAYDTAYDTSLLGAGVTGGSMVGPLGGLGAAQQYRRITDDQMFVADDPTQLPCAGPESCSFEPLPQGGSYLTVYPKGAAAQSTTQSPSPYVPTQVVATRSFKDVLIEALALGMMGGGAVAFGYGLAKPKVWVTIGGLLLVVAGAGLRLSVLVPWLTRSKDALLTTNIVRVA
jgi:hypothetical protein